MRGSNWLGWLGAISVLMVSVFLITFFTNFSPVKAPVIGDNSPKNSASAVADLSFVERQFPNDPALPATIHEISMPGSHDFWFTNENTVEVVFGLEFKNCTCASVEVFTLPPEWLLQPEALALGKGKTPTARDLASAGESPALKALEATLKPTSLENKDGITLKIPPGSLGWIRLRYNNEKIGPITLTSKFWLGSPDTGVSTRLEIRNDVVPVFLANPGEVRLGLLSPLRPVVTGELIALSATRKKLSLLTESKIKFPKGDIIETLAPVLLTEKEITDLSKKLNLKVSVAYRIGVRGHLPKEDKNEAQSEFGPYARAFRIVCLDLPESDTHRAANFTINGSVESDVRVLGADPEGSVPMNNFPWTVGKKFQVRLESLDPNAKLEIDLGRTSSFLKIRQLGEPEKLRRGTAYDYEILIGGGKVRGAFPREEGDASLRDSAFYIRSVGPKSRLIRVPVSGRGDDE